MIRLPYDACREVPWRNGGGVSREIAEGPGWTLRTATIARDGPFSSYAGLQRHFAIVAGAVELRFDGQPPVRCAAGDPPIVFDGGIATDCRVDRAAGEAALALNLIVDPLQVAATLVRCADADAGGLVAPPPIDRSVADGTEAGGADRVHHVGLFVQCGALHDRDGLHRAGRFDTLRFASDAEATRLRAGSDGFAGLWFRIAPAPVAAR